MNYQQLSETIHRPCSTVRKWRAEIAEISGIDFERVKIRNGRGRKNRTTYNFSETDVQDFQKLSSLLLSGKSKENSIIEIFGSKKQAVEQKKNSLLSQLAMRGKNQGKSIVNLENEVQTLQNELYTMKMQICTLTKRLEAQENKGFFSSKKRK